MRQWRDPRGKEESPTYGASEFSPLAQFKEPPFTCEERPADMLFSPPLTVAYWAEIQLARPNTNPPTDENAFWTPPTRLCDPLRMAPVKSGPPGTGPEGVGPSLYPSIKLPRPVGVPLSSVRPDPLRTCTFTPVKIT